MSVLRAYVKAMRGGHDFVCSAIEREHGLYGYPPEMVSVALNAIDDGLDPDEAITDYIDGKDEEDHTA